MTMKPPAMSDGERPCPAARMRGVHRGWSTPSDWNALDDAVPQMRADDDHAEHVEGDHQRVAEGSPSPGGRDRVRPPATRTRCRSRLNALTWMSRKTSSQSPETIIVDEAKRLAARRGPADFFFA